MISKCQPSRKKHENKNQKKRKKFHSLSNGLRKETTVGIENKRILEITNEVIEVIELSAVIVVIVEILRETIETTFPAKTKR